MTVEAWIALVGLAITSGTALCIISFRLGILSNRVFQREKEADALALRVTSVEKSQADTGANLLVIKALLDNINTAVNTRKAQP